ncbi:MAG TPA: crosslink repair DNA glycosylase YcaQ family protein [Thermoplasmata archaeon]|nr:crosslink repair DNA glycosylase YcaQ family protein [Thermoplasmata archaeon]
MARRAPKIEVSLAAVRRLAVTKQHLTGARARRPTPSTILRVVRDLGCLQLDPINVVAPSHLLVLWSRLGAYRTSAVDRLLWKDRTLFEYWGHQASIVLTEDFPLYYGMMRRVPATMPAGWGRTWRSRVERWVARHAELRTSILTQLRENGPLFSRQFARPRSRRPTPRGWGSGDEVSEMLQILFLRGEVMTAGRVGIQKLWDLPERCLPAWVSKRELTPAEVEYEAAQRSLRSLGVATLPQIRLHFLRGRYRSLRATAERLEAEGTIVRVGVVGSPFATPAYVHREDLALLQALEEPLAAPRTTLLSPFDNLICDRDRTARLFGFEYRFEGYVPKGKRRFGPYSLPILHGESLIGRVDPVLDRDRGCLTVRGVHAERGAPEDPATVESLRRSIDGLASFLRATDVRFIGPLPAAWRGVADGNGV